MAGREELGPYRIVKRIAAGGMAEIFLARQRGIEGLERTVVIKQILQKHEQNEEFITMFLDEARLMAALSHPHIAQVLDLGKTDETHYLVMEYVRGPTLGALLQAAGRAGLRGLPEKPALGVALAIAEALDYVHARRDELGRPLGIVHRDLNPANVVVSWDGAVKLIDFGIAKAASRVYETRTGVIKGTYGYIAPEGLRGGPVDLRADVFAIGILLYEMLIGSHPFDQSDEPNLVDRIVEARYKKPREVRPDISASLDRLISRCLAPHPEGRPASMRELIEGLTADMSTRGIVPTQGDLAHLACQLIPDEEGPQPLRRPTAASSSSRPAFARDGGTRPVRHPRAGESEAGTQPAFEREEEPTRRLPRDVVDPPAPVLSEPDDEAGTTMPTTPRPDLDAALALAVPVRSSAQPTAPPSPPRPRREPSTPMLPRNVSRATPTPPLGVALDTTLRVVPTKRHRLPPALGGLAVVAAGVLAFLVARQFGGAPESTSVQLGPSTAIADGLPGAVDEAPRRSLAVVSEPPGAAIRLDGVDTGLATPSVVGVDPRVVRIFIEVALPGHRRQGREVATSAGTARFVLEQTDQLR